MIGVGRNPQRCEAALQKIRAAAGTNEVLMLRADLALMSEAARLANDIKARTKRIDVLLNNAGGTPSERASSTSRRWG